MTAAEGPDLYPAPSEWSQRARMNSAAYDAARTAARETPEPFWSEQARRLDWMTAPTHIKDVSFKEMKQAMAQMGAPSA